MIIALSEEDGRAGLGSNQDALGLGELPKVFPSSEPPMSLPWDGKDLLAAQSSSPLLQFQPLAPCAELASSPASRKSP